MLKTNKSITVNGSSDFNGKSAMMFNATIRPDGTTNVNASIINQDVYDGNKKAAQKDLADFNTKVFELVETSDNDGDSQDTNVTNTATTNK